MTKTLGRRDYVIAGLVFFTVKHNIDRLIASWVFGHEWSILNYLFLFDPAGEMRLYPPAFLLTLLATSLPFAAIGVLLTVKRLRDSGLSLALAALFFVPVINLLFFAVLSILPSVAERDEAPSSGRNWTLKKICPVSASGSAFVAVIGTALIFIPLIALGIKIFEVYGWVLFVGFPFAQGMVAAMIFGCHQPRKLSACLGVATLTIVVDGVLLLSFALEGIICILMAAPIALVLALFGAAVGYLVQAGCRSRNALPAAPIALILLLPFLTAMESIVGPAPSIFKVTTSIDINAPPDVVWNNVVTFSDLPEPNEWIFRLGIAYPTHATIDGAGVGAIRKCTFSTGHFIEPITVWDEPRLLKFSVTENPAPMQEWTPYAKIHPPHLDGFLASRSGQFLLEPLENGRTRLVGTTWYQHHLFPETYWQQWSDFVIHKIHLRVLNHIKMLSEARDE